jgi:hypothetical protein
MVKRWFKCVNPVYIISLCEYIILSISTEHTLYVYVQNVIIMYCNGKMGPVATDIFGLGRRSAVDERDEGLRC